MSEKKPGGEEPSNLVPPERLEQKRRQKEEERNAEKLCDTLDDLKITEIALAISPLLKAMNFKERRAAVDMERAALQRTIAENSLEELIRTINISNEENWKKRPAFYQAALKILGEKGIL